MLMRVEIEVHEKTKGNTKVQTTTETDRTSIAQRIPKKTFITTLSNNMYKNNVI